MTKSKKLKLIFDMAADGAKKSEIYKKIGITGQAFNRNKEYMNRYNFGCLKSQTDLIGMVTKETVDSVNKAREFIPVVPDGFAIDKSDLKSLKSIKEVSARVSMAVINGEIIESRANVIQRVLREHSNHIIKHMEEVELREEIENLEYVR
ncbi:MAG: hypothetical protein DRG78_21345 [Epsilonproteobacteria bacterium]|nr:MAG: hypothetical protein DRG78_21345 [Campylobacterota bacterium]